MIKILKGTFNVLTWIIVISSVALAILLVGTRLIGFTPYTVLSGSMEPTYHTGSIIYVKSVEPQNIKIGDPITFVYNKDLVVVTHRVVEIDEENQNFYTKGDANNTVDVKPVYFKNLIGKPVYTIPYLGYVSNYITTFPGMFVALGIAVMLLALIIIGELFKRK